MFLVGRERVHWEQMGLIINPTNKIVTIKLGFIAT